MQLAIEMSTSKTCYFYIQLPALKTYLTYETLVHHLSLHGSISHA